MMNDYYKKWCCIIVFDKPFSSDISSDVIYKENLDAVKEYASTLGCCFYIYSDNGEGDTRKRLADSDAEAVAAAFKDAFDAGLRKVIIVDPSYKVSLKLLEEGFSAMKMIEFCIGPLTAGGYYMLGMNYFEPVLFSEADQKMFYDSKKMIRNIGQLRHMLYKLPVLSDKADLALK